MSPAGARRRLAPQERREELLAAAERALRRLGARCRVEDVVAEANAAKGTFYVYFPSWEDLLEALRARVFEDFDRRVADLPSPCTRKDWWAFLESSSERFVDFVLEMDGLHEALFHGALLEPTEDGGAVGRVAGLLQAGSEARAFAVADVDATARLVFALLHETVDSIEAGQDRAAALRALRDFLRRGLGGPRG